MTDLILPPNVDPPPEPFHESSTRLARDLAAAGSPELANRARRDEFNDFFSEHENPQGHLIAALRKQIETLERAARKAPRVDRQAMTAEAGALRGVYRSVLRSRYRATRTEADLWARHEDRILAARQGT